MKLISQLTSTAVQISKGLATGNYRPRLCKNIFQRDRYSKPGWKSRFYAKSKSADVPINFRFNVDAHTAIGEAFLHTLGQKRPFEKLSYDQKPSFQRSVSA
jgi:hypothetical protein